MTLVSANLGRRLRIFNRLKLFVASLALTAAYSSATAEEQDVLLDIDYFSLWNDCGAIELLVEFLNADAVRIGLTRERVETTVGSRLRAAGIYSEEMKEAFLYVNITVGSNFFGMNVEFKQWLSAAVANERRIVSGSATT